MVPVTYVVPVTEPMWFLSLNLCGSYHRTYVVLITEPVAIGQTSECGILRHTRTPVAEGVRNQSGGISGCVKHRCEDASSLADLGGSLQKLNCLIREMRRPG